MLPVISDFLQGTLTDSLKKPLQPAGLFAAAVFVLLNLVFVFSSLGDSGSRFASVFPNDAWKLAVASVLVVVLAYLLLSLNTVILAAMTGESWRESLLLGRFWCRWQGRKRDAMRLRIERMEQGGATVASNQARADMITSFSTEPEHIAPTALGNVLNATAGYLWEHYRIDMVALWPHMETVVADLSGAALATRLGNAKGTLDFLLNLAVVLVAFAAEYLALQVGFPLDMGQWSAVLWSALSLALAYLAYRVAVQAAGGWGNVVQMAFDLHRDDLRKALGLRAFASQADGRTVWERISRSLLWKDPVDDVFGGEPSHAGPSPSVTTSGNAAIALVDSTLTRERDPDNRTAETARWTAYVNYVILVGAAPPAQDACDTPPAEGVYVLVVDPQAPSIDAAPAADPQDWPGGDVPSAAILPGTGTETPGQRLLWRIDRLPANGTRALRYRLPQATYTASTGDPALRISADIEEGSGLVALECTLTITNIGLVAADATLTIRDTLSPSDAAPSTGELRIGIDDAKPKAFGAEYLDGSDCYVWTLDKLDIGVTATLRYATVQKQ